MLRITKTITKAILKQRAIAQNKKSIKMTQEAQVILTLEVDASKNKEDIKRFFLDMEMTYTRTVSAKNRWDFPKLTIVDVKEEAEIYNNQITREQFMEFFRSEDFHTQVTPDDAREIFRSVLHGSSDLTAELINSVLSDYGVKGIMVVKTNDSENDY